MQWLFCAGLRLLVYLEKIWRMLDYKVSNYLKHLFVVKDSSEVPAEISKFLSLLLIFLSQKTGVHRASVELAKSLGTNLVFCAIWQPTIPYCTTIREFYEPQSTGFFVALLSHAPLSDERNRSWSCFCSSLYSGEQDWHITDQDQYIKSPTTLILVLFLSSLPSRVLNKMEKYFRKFNLIISKFMFIKNIYTIGRKLIDLYNLT